MSDGISNRSAPGAWKTTGKRWRAILIAGPTAAGKSALAEGLADTFGGPIVNADSMQVYADLRILTARPMVPEGAADRYRLYGTQSGEVAYSVGRWIADIGALLDAFDRTVRIPVIVGGTGLYFKALLEGLSPVPDIPEQVRAHWRREAARLGAEELYGMLAERDPATAATLRPSDTQRLTRALEVFDATGAGLVSWRHREKSPLLSTDDALRLVVRSLRDVIHTRADARFDEMMREGALEEVRALLSKGYSPELPIMRALGVAPLAAHLRGEMQLVDAITRAKLDTRQYIKRQETWLKRHMMSWKWLSSQEVERLERQDFTFIGS